jgi:hypothetical protein
MAVSPLRVVAGRGHRRPVRGLRLAALEDGALVTGGLSPLRQALVAAAAEAGCPLKDLTVLAPQNDPFRVDTPAGHRDGEWLAITARELGLGDRRIHLRGLHYMVLGRPKPDGSPYANTEEDWEWLQAGAGKAARFLGYIPFEQIVDQRNAEPAIREFSHPDPYPYLTVGIDVEIPDAEEITPRLGVADFRGVQPYHLVLVGEKSSLGEVLEPIARGHDADLYLPTGEPSDTLLYRMAAAAVTDGRPMAVLYFSDCDPAGWTMPVSVSRKLQAFNVLLPDMPEFEVHRVALIPEQVREYGLPSTPLKDTEKRKDKWRQAWGVDQTEIDALASLQPDLLRRIARDAITPFYDRSLPSRVQRAADEWTEAAVAVVDSQVDAERLASIHAEAERLLDGMREQIADLNSQLRIDVRDFDLPPIVVPAAELNGHRAPAPLLDSRHDFAAQCRRLIASKSYEPETT